jgi:hypothetical protein
MPHFSSVQMPPRISVVTPSFNQGRYLEDCIRSVLDQGYPDLEYIIMDGGSTDGSVEIIRRYADRIAYWQSRPDGGQYAAITAGFERSSGRIMTWLNADDKFHPDAFAIAAAIFMTQPEVRWISGRSNTFKQSGEQCGIHPVLIRWKRRRYLEGQWATPCIQQEGTFWRRDLWDQSGGRMDTDLDLAGDMELWARFFRYAPVHVLDALMAGYRLQPLARSSLHWDRYCTEACTVIFRERALFEQGKCTAMPPAPPLILSPQIGEMISRAGLRRLADPRWQTDPWALGGHQRCKTFYQSMVAQYPVCFEAFNQLGMLTVEEEDYPAAIKCFTEALRITPGYKEAFLNLEQLLQHMGHHDYARRLREQFTTLGDRSPVGADSR